MLRKGKFKHVLENKHVFVYVLFSFYIFVCFGGVWVFEDLGWVGARRAPPHLTLLLLILQILVWVLEGFGWGGAWRAPPHLTLPFCFFLSKTGMFLRLWASCWVAALLCKPRHQPKSFVSGSWCFLLRSLSKSLPSKSFSPVCSLHQFRKSIFVFSFLQHPLSKKQLPFVVPFSIFLLCFVSILLVSFFQNTSLTHPLFQTKTCFYFCFVLLFWFWLFRGCLN